MDTFPKCRKIDINSITHPTLKKLIKTVQDLDIEFEMLNFTNVFNIPIIITVFNHKDWNIQSNYLSRNTRFPATTIGVETDPQDAALRCFTELLQGLPPLYDLLSLEETIRIRYKTSKLSLSSDLIDTIRMPHFEKNNISEPLSISLKKYIDQKREAISILDIQKIYDINQKLEIEKIVNILKDKNVEILINDITNPNLPFPVVSTMLSGGEGYFSKIPLTGHTSLMLRAIDNEKRLSIFNQKINRILTKSKILDYLDSEEWCTNPNQSDFLNYIITKIFRSGSDEFLFGLPINVYYFLSLLFIRMKRYHQAMNCIDAALIGNLDNISFILTKAYLLKKTHKKEEFNQIMEYIKIINYNNIDIQEALQKYDDPIVHPNPFEPCDYKCKQQNKPHLCEKCFFHYIPEEIFMKTMLDKR